MQIEQSVFDQSVTIKTIKSIKVSPARSENFILLLCVGEEVSSKILESGGKVDDSDVNPTEIFRYFQW